MLEQVHEPQSAACEAAAAAAAAKNSSPAPVLIIDAPWWFCTSDSVGNHLSLYFTLRALALLHGIGFQMKPTCGPIIRDTPKHIIGWLPQSASPNWPPEVPRDPGTIMREIEGTCSRTKQCRSIITHYCTHGWPFFAAVWRREIRAAAERYSVARRGCWQAAAQRRRSTRMTSMMPSSTFAVGTLWKWMRHGARSLLGLCH